MGEGCVQNHNFVSMDLTIKSIATVLKTHLSRSPMGTFDVRELTDVLFDVLNSVSMEERWRKWVRVKVKSGFCSMDISTNMNCSSAKNSLST